MANTTLYAVPRCTYVELRDEKNNKRFTITAKECKQKNIIPLAVENYKPLTEFDQAIVRAYLRNKTREHKGQKTEQIKISGKVVTKKQASDTMKRALTRVYLTAGGLDLIRAHKTKFAETFKDMPMYVLSPMITTVQPEEVTVTVDPEVTKVDSDGEQDAEKKGIMGKILLALAGWALFN